MRARSVPDAAQPSYCTMAAASPLTQKATAQTSDASKHSAQGTAL